MTDPVFVDTNVFVYRFDTSEPHKQRRAAAWLEHLWSSRRGRVSRQVQHELYAVLTRRLPMPRRDARRIVSSLEVWAPVELGRDLMDAAWALEDRHSLSWWDALILAAAEASGARVLLSEDLSGGSTYGAVRVVNPFLEEPPAEPDLE